MPDFSLLGGGARYETSPPVGSRPVRLTSGFVANTKGAYVTLIASTSMDTVGLGIAYRIQNAADFLVDIAVGAAASEEVIVPNLLMGTVSAKTSDQMTIPLFIPAGSRISARCQASTGDSDVDIHARIHGQSFPPSSPLGRITDYGPDTSTSGGVLVDPGAVVNVKGAYSEITAATTNNIKMLWGRLSANRNQVMGTARCFMDIAIGAGGSEQIIMPDIWYASHTEVDKWTPAVLGPYPIIIPAGTRLAARTQCSINNATDRLVDVALYGGD